VIRILASVVLLVVASGCSTLTSWVPGILQGEDNSIPPVALAPLENQVSLTRRWSRDIGVGFDEFSLNLRPAIEDGRVFAADRKGRVVALDSLSGDEIWSVKTGAAVSAGPGVGEGLVLLGTSNAQVIALDADDGSELWRTEVSSEVLSIPQTDFGKVIVQTADDNVTALDAGDGTSLWIYDRSAPVLTLRGTSTPAVQQGVVVAGFSSGKLVALEAEKGLVGWETSVAIPQGRSELERIVDIDGSPVIVGTTVYVATYQGRIAAVELRSGTLGWKRDISTYAGIGVDYSQVYVTDADSHVWALSRNTGAAAWKQDKLANRKLTGPAPFSDYVAVGDFEGYVHLLSRYDGDLIARVEVDGKGIAAQPQVVDDVLYIYGNSGKLAAYTIE
jgi:outer membrane protein assembly factor BamB